MSDHSLHSSDISVPNRNHTFCWHGYVHLSLAELDSIVSVSHQGHTQTHPEKHFVSMIHQCVVPFLNHSNCWETNYYTHPNTATHTPKHSHAHTQVQESENLFGCRSRIRFCSDATAVVVTYMFCDSRDIRGGRLV